MKRRHLRADIFATISRARDLRPGIAIGADMIAGFPTEDEELFRDTLDVVQAGEIPFLHVFPYSERPGTPAARMPAIPVAERRARAARLREAAAIAAARFHASQLGREVNVLAETDSAGHTEHFSPVRIAASPGALLRARVTAADGAGLIAVAA
jgi:threonylcarbamoyladenosine tRNA methylthiotransferase MtaB